jgi:SAM-dependent methyltransferase
VAEPHTSEIVGLGSWLATAPGRYVLDWEQTQFDELTANWFGYRALQMGLTQVDALRRNRMPQRWAAVSSLQDLAGTSPQDAGDTQAAADVDAARGATAADPVLVADFTELPFESASLDLVVLPHTLEFVADPHACLREVERVLMPEGRVLICGFNGFSLWGLRQTLGRHLGPLGGGYFLPRAGEFIAYTRCKDWLRLLGFQMEKGRFGCYRPPVGSARWLERFAFVEPVGERWWPVLGAVYVLIGVKRVRGMRLVGPAWKAAGRARAGRLTTAVPTSSAPLQRD